MDNDTSKAINAIWEDLADIDQNLDYLHNKYARLKLELGPVINYLKVANDFIRTNIGDVKIRIADLDN